MPPSPWMTSMQMPQTSLENVGGFQGGDVVEGDELDIRHDGLEGLAVGRLVRGATAHGAAVEGVLEGEKLRADAAAFSAQEASVRAGELQRSFPGLAAGVAEEDAIEAA